METEAPKKNKGGRPRKRLDTSSAEFREALAAGIAAAMPQMIEGLRAQIQIAQGATGSGDQDDPIRRLAMAMADMADQGTGRVRIAPDELTKRNKALEAMGNLLMEAHAAGDIPEYELLDKIVVADRLVQPFQDVDGVATPTVIEWSGPPGPVMRPVNLIAKKIFEQYVIYIGGLPDTVNGLDKNPKWVTLGKVTVKTSANARFREPPRRQVGNFADSNVGEAFSPEPEGPHFEVKRPQDPRSREVNILGTVAKAAVRELGPTQRM